MSKPIPGFDYRTGQHVEHPRAWWREALRNMVNIGGWRRVEGGVTYCHLRNKWGQPEIVFEIYTILPEPKREGGRRN